MPEDTDVADAATQDSPEAGEQTDDLDAETAAAAEEDAQADTPETDTGDETTDADQGDGPGKGLSPTLQKLLDKYGGDEELLVNAYFEQANSSSRLHAEIEELKEYLLNRDLEDDDPEALLAEDPDVKSLNEELAALQQEVEAIQQEQMHLVGQYGQIEGDIKVLEVEASKAEDFEKTTLRQQVASRKAELGRVMTTINQGRREMNRINRESRGLQRTAKQAERNVLDRRDQAKKAELRSAGVARLTRDEFNVAMRAEAKGFGVDPSSKQFAILNSSIRNQISAHLNRLPKDAPGIDIGAAVKHLMGEYAEAWGMKSNFKKVSAVKGRTPENSGPKTPVQGGPQLPKGMREPNVPKGMKQFGPDGKNWTPEFAKARAKQFLGE
ncbi:MAG: hypothetical protein GY906_24910 [bacterium]|nr:hypothetical protein [bacterium]